MEKPVEKKIIKTECYKCLGTGKVLGTDCVGEGDMCYTHENDVSKRPCMETCNICKGTGCWEESHYYFIDEKNKIAVDGDTLK